MRKYVFYMVAVLSLLQTIEFCLGNNKVKGIGLASVASPLPIVFTQFRGVETFSLDYYLKVEHNQGQIKSFKLDSKKYSKLKAPYNVRNVIFVMVLSQDL